MTHEENRKIVWDACVKANPAKVWVEEAFDEYDATIEIHADPNAADVLLALGETKKGLSLYLGNYGLSIYYNETGDGFVLDLRATLSSWDEASVAALAALLKDSN